MILNAYSVLALFVAALEFALGVLLVVGAIRARRRASLVEAQTREIDGAPRSGLLLLAAGALLGTSLAAWPILYLLLDSYVPQWEDVMCIQGVLRIGTGSEGAQGWLPTLALALQVLKPLLVFAMGASLLVHLANRATKTDPLTGRLLALLAAAGLLAVLDAGVEAAYVTIPKRDNSLARGCCTATAEPAAGSGFVGDGTGAGAGGGSRLGLLVGFFTATLWMAGWTWFASGRGTGGPVAGAAGTTPLFLAAAASLPIGLVFLRNVAAPAFLGRPDHLCAYCLVSDAPLGLLAMALYVLGVFATGWACILRWTAGVEETREFLPDGVRSLLRWGAIGWIGAAIVTAIPVVTA